MHQPATLIAEAEIEEKIDDFETLLDQVLIHAIRHGMLPLAVEGLMVHAADGMGPAESVCAVMEDLGLPEPIRVH